MASYKTEAIILKRLNFSEADRIITCFSKNLGKINMIAKGARRITSKKGGTLELLNWCSLSIASGKNLDLVLESEVIRSFLPVKHDLYKTSLAYQLIEVCDRLTIDRQPSKELFQLLIKTLDDLSKEPSRKIQKLHIAIFQLKSLELLGFYVPQKKQISTKPLSSSLLLQISELSQPDSLVCINNDSVDSLFAYSQGLVEEVAERQIKSSKFIQELDNSFKILT